jgi:hypothetical protein
MAKENLPAEVQEYLRQKGERLGKQFGALGGLATAKKLTAAQRKRNAKKASAAAADALTPEERKERARKAAAARWGKKDAQ